MSCNIARCLEKHQGTHFKITTHSHLHEFDLIVTGENYAIKFRNDFTLGYGKVSDLIFDKHQEGFLPDSAGDLFWEDASRKWRILFKGGIYQLLNLDACLVAGAEIYATKRPGRSGTTSVTIDDVPIKERYEYTGAHLRFVPGGKS